MKEDPKADHKPGRETRKSGLKINRTEKGGRSAEKKQRVLSSCSETDLERRIRERTAELVRANEELEQEIADRRRAEERAMKSQERLFDILESISDGFFTLDRRWRFTYVNHEAVRLWRRGLGELIGRSIWEVVPDAVGTVFYEQYHRAVAEKVPASFEALSPLLNIWVEVRAYPSKEGLSVYFHDITERKIAQENVLRLNRLYSVLSKINEAIVRIRKAEELYEEVCRIAVEDGLLRMAWIGLKDPVTLEVKPVARWGDEGGYLDTIRVVAADVPEGKGPTGRAVFEGKHFICSDIEVDPLMRPWKEKALSHGFRSSAAFPLRIGQDAIGAFTIYSEKPSFFTGEEIELFLSMAGDVSFAIDFIENERRRRAVEAALRDLNEELERKVKERTAGLEEAYREMEAFSYSVSHDLRSPLRIINGFAQAVLEDYGDKLDDKGKDLLKIIGTNAIRMDRLINGLLDLSRIGRQEMNVAEIDMEKMAKALCNDIGGTLSGRKVLFAVQPLPSVRGDAVLLRQVFENLLSNAVKFTRKRQEAVIEIGGRKDGREHVYFVRDNGVGFSMQYADKLFRVFQRLHNVKEFEGTGIGLSIVHRIVQKHGGRIWAEAKAKEGATFYVALPGK
ncbi:MAG: ATP-binding protein [Acidobacteriota bacterium]